MKTLYNGNGRPIQLGAELGKGGEGAVYEVVGNTELVAKVYLKPTDEKKVAKLMEMVSRHAKMVACLDEQLRSLATWPIDVLRIAPTGKISGFLMRRLVGLKEIHDLYGVKSRLAEFPDATWPFLIDAAKNLARALSVLQERGYSVGDINPRNIVVLKDATVVFLDADSFQFRAGSQRYPCEVFSTEYTPPELQGQRGGAERTVDHDSFGLAVLIFRLLFMGRHPFAGRFTGQGDPSPEQAIREFRFAYGPGAASRGMIQPPASLSLDSVPSQIARMFELAFLQPTNRPKPSEWVSALTDLSKSLKKCDQNLSHDFIRTQSDCPWCPIEAQAGIALFPIRLPPDWRQRGPFNVATLWSVIESIQPPRDLPALPEKSSLVVRPSSQARRVRYKRHGSLSLACLGVIAAGTLILFSGFSNEAIVWSFIGILFLGSVVCSAVQGEDMTLKTALDTAQKRWRELEQLWQEKASLSGFHSKRNVLESKKKEYLGLSALRQRKLRKLEDEQKERQLHRHLDRYRIDRANISGIGPSRTTTLQSYGIETAADLNSQAILSVPGFGPVYASKLLGWRRLLESRFVFNPVEGVNPADVQVVEQEITALKLRLERELTNGPNDLRRLCRDIEAARTSLQSSVTEGLTTLAQAEIDQKASSRTVAPFAAVLISLLASAAIGLPLRQAGTSALRGFFDSSFGHATSQTQPKNSNFSPPAKSSNDQAPVINTEKQSKFLYNNGVELTKQNSFEEAAQEFRNSIALAPGFAGAHHELGYALYRLGKYRESADSSREAIRLDAKNVKSQRNLGLALKALNQWSEAVKAFRQALKITPDDPQTLYNLGVSLRNTHDYEAAIAALQDAVRVKPDYAVAHYELGLAYIAMDDTQAALDEYSRLHELNERLAQKLHDALTPAETQQPSPRTR